MPKAQFRHTHFLGTIGAGLAWANRTYLSARAVTLAEAIWSPALTADAERALRLGHPPFKECADCPEMVVVPEGEFTMGSPEGEKGRYAEEGPERRVAIARAFAVSRFEITSDEWDACVILGGCAWPAPETGWGRGGRPVMNVSWDDAQQYVKWLRVVGSQPSQPREQTRRSPLTGILPSFIDGKLLPKLRVVDSDPCVLGDGGCTRSGLGPRRMLRHDFGQHRACRGGRRTAQTAAADEFAASLLPIVNAIRATGATTLEAIRRCG
jgi:hypothetical protein